MKITKNTITGYTGFVGISQEMTVKELASIGGKASAKKRFEGKTKEEISEIMRTVKKAGSSEKLYSK